MVSYTFIHTSCNSQAWKVPLLKAWSLNPVPTLFTHTHTQADELLWFVQAGSFFGISFLYIMSCNLKSGLSLIGGWCDVSPKGEVHGWYRANTVVAFLESKDYPKYTSLATWVDYEISIWSYQIRQVTSSSGPNGFSAEDQAEHSLSSTRHFSKSSEESFENKTAN